MIRLLLPFILAAQVLGLSTNIVTVRPSGGDYSTLSAAEAGAQKNLVAADECTIIEIQGDWSGTEDTTAVVVDGWTTDSTRTLTIRANSSNRATAQYSTSKYRLVVSTGRAIDVVNNYVTIEGIQVSDTSTSSHAAIYVADIGYISGCIIKGSASGDGSAYYIGVQVAGQGVVWNCVAYDFTSANGFTSAFFANNVGIFRNCTAQNCYNSFYSNGSSAVAVNCLNQDAINDGFVGTWATANNNASDISSDAPGTSAQTGDVSFANVGSDDFHLASGDTVAKDNGSDLSGTFTNDIDNQTRSGTWDIGADEYQAVASSHVSSVPVTKVISW